MDAPSERGPTLPIVVSLIWGALLLPAAGVAMMSPMMFDAPGSTNDASLVLTAGCIASFPILCVASIIATWTAWSSTRADRSMRTRIILIACAVLPLVPALIVALVAATHWGKTG